MDTTDQTTKTWANMGIGQYFLDTLRAPERKQIIKVESYNVSEISDPLYFLKGGQYIPLTKVNVC